MDSQLIREADWVLSKCGRPTAPQGASAVYIPHSFLMQSQIQPSGQVTLEKEITGDTTFVLRAIQAIYGGVYWQARLPNGELLINSPALLNELVGYGSARFVFPRESECEPGSKIQLSLSNVVTAVAFLFEGAYRYYVRGGKSSPASALIAASIPRYLDHPNQNILAPSWMHGVGPLTPDGYRDSPFTYSSSQISLTGTGTGAFGNLGIQIESGSDFVARRFLFECSEDAGVTSGSILVRLRSASGYLLNDDYIDLARYVGSAYLAHDWWIKAGDALICEFQLVDYTGSGNLYMTVHAGGCKRVKR